MFKRNDRTVHSISKRDWSHEIIRKPASRRRNSTFSRFLRILGQLASILLKRFAQIVSDRVNKMVISSVSVKVDLT